MRCFISPVLDDIIIVKYSGAVDLQAKVYVARTTIRF